MSVLYCDAAFAYAGIGLASCGEVPLLEGGQQNHFVISFGQLCNKLVLLLGVKLLKSVNSSTTCHVTS